MVVVSPTAPDVAVLIPVILCPECGALETAGFIGNASREVVAADRGHFEDRAGFLHCSICGLVWTMLYELPSSVDIDRRNLPPTIFASEALGIGAGFNARDARNFKVFRNLGRRNARVASGRSYGHSKRAADRLYDAEALCALLDLPSDVKAAVTYHIKTLAARADMRELCNRLREDGKVRSVRSEAVTIATVALVMERFHIHRDDALQLMLDAFHFTRGPPSITPDEYRAAYTGCAAWFGAHLWRDGPEDNNPKEGTNP